MATPSPPLCPWPFLGGLEDPVLRQREENQGLDALSEAAEIWQDVPESFAQEKERPLTLAERIRKDQPQVVDVEALPSPVMNGDVPTVTLGREALERGRNFCRFSLIGRLDFGKMSIVRARALAAELWAPAGDWKLIPLGNGFFMLRLVSRDDFIRIWAQPWKFGNQTVRFIRWTPEFDTDKQKSANALTWVRFPKLKQQYWDYELLMTLGKGLGTPIGVDQRTIDREYGYFANVLVEIDLSKPIPEGINVKEEDGKEFFQAIEIPRLPAYCNHCKTVGHEITQCRGLRKAMQQPEDRENRGKEAVNRGDSNRTTSMFRDSRRYGGGVRDTTQAQGDTNTDNENGGERDMTVGVMPPMEVGRGSGSEDHHELVQAEQTMAKSPAGAELEGSITEQHMQQDHQDGGTVVLETQVTQTSNAFEALANLNQVEEDIEELERLVAAQTEGDRLVDLVNERAMSSQKLGVVGGSKGRNLPSSKKRGNINKVANNEEEGIGRRTRFNQSIQSTT